MRVCVSQVNEIMWSLLTSTNEKLSHGPNKKEKVKIVFKEGKQKKKIFSSLVFIAKFRYFKKGKERSPILENFPFWIYFRRKLYPNAREEGNQLKAKLASKFHLRYKVAFPEFD